MQTKLVNSNPYYQVWRTVLMANKLKAWLNSVLSETSQEKINRAYNVRVFSTHAVVADGIGQQSLYSRWRDKFDFHVRYSLLRGGRTIRYRLFIKTECAGCVRAIMRKLFEDPSAKVALIEFRETNPIVHDVVTYLFFDRQSVTNIPVDVEHSETRVRRSGTPSHQHDFFSGYPEIVV